jgi:hypothetical protein
MLFDDLEQDATEHQAQWLLGLPAWQGADDLATTPSISTSASLPLSSCGVSPDQLLQPPTHADTSSSVSSQGSKQQHEPSPVSQPRQPSYHLSQRDLRAPSQQSPSQHPPEHLQQPSSYDADIVVELQTQLCEAEEEIDHLQQYSAQDYAVGYEQVTPMALSMCSTSQPNAYLHHEHGGKIHLGNACMPDRATKKLNKCMLQWNNCATCSTMRVTDPLATTSHRAGPHQGPHNLGEPHQGHHQQCRRPTEPLKPFRR